MKWIYRLAVVLCLNNTAANAAYKVDIDAPSPLHSLLTDFLDLVRYQDREELSTEQFKFLVDTVDAQVKQLAATEGYFSPTSKVTVENDAVKNAPQHVHLTVDPGPRTNISAVDITAIGAVADKDTSRLTDIQNNWLLPVGEPFRQEDWDAAKDRGLQSLQANRYAAARIAQSQARIEADEQHAQLSVQYDSGPVFTLGELQITGAKRYPESIIRHVNPLYPGEEYSASRLLALQHQIQNTPYYSNAIVSIDEQSANPDRVPVKVQVSEYPTQRVRAGVGYGSDTGAQVEGRYTHYNVFNRAWVFDSQLRLEQKRQYGTLNLAMPPDEKNFVNSINATSDRTKLQGIDLRSQHFGIKRARNNELYDTFYTLTLYRDQLQQSDGATPPSDTIITPGEHQALVPGFAWARRDVDDPIFPRRGHLLTLETGVALKGILTDQSFVRFYGRFKKYIPVAKRDLIILRTELGAVFTKGRASEVPASLLFRAGGNESVRGYSYQSIGNEQNGTVYPTKYLLTASSEYQHWFTEVWGSALFYDIGTAADSWSEKSFYQGFGVGARWRSPVGSLNLDLAYGVQKKQIRPHISLGIAF